MKNIFILSSSYYEDYKNYYFYGPPETSQEQFNDLCKKLLDKAGEEAILKQKRERHPNFIGMNEVVEELAVLLLRHGYTPFSPKLANFWGPSILDSDKYLSDFNKSGQSILDFNLEIMKSYRDSNK